MKKLLTTLLFGSFFSACAERQPVPAIPSDPEIEGKIEKLLKGMTLEEKIGQMCELTIGAVTDKNDNKLSEALLDTVIGKYKVGSLLNIPFGVSQKKEVFAEVITQIQKKSLEEIGIPCIYGLDQIHGASYTQDATYFPQGINMAAAFNRELTRHCAEITGLRDSRLLCTMDVCSCNGSRARSSLAAYVGEFRGRCLCECANGCAGCTWFAGG